MKKLLTFLLIMLPLAFASCGGDDFEDELSVISSQNKLVGDWRNTMTNFTEGNQTIVWYFNLYSGKVDKVLVNDVVSDDKELNAQVAEYMSVLHYSGKQYTVSGDGNFGSYSSVGMSVYYDGTIYGGGGFLSYGSNKILKLTNDILIIETIDGDKKYTRTFSK